MVVMTVAAGTHNLGENVTYEQTGNGGKRLSYKIVGDNIDKMSDHHFNVLISVQGLFITSTAMQFVIEWIYCWHV